MYSYLILIIIKVYYSYNIYIAYIDKITAWKDLLVEKLVLNKFFE